jgi:NADH-quinone oxidoreductase subunit L
LYPDPAEVAFYFQAAALPNWLFDLLIITATVLTVASWSYLYMRAHGRAMWMPAWIAGVRIRLYVLFMNRLYADELYQLLGQATMRLIHLIDKRDQGWSR